MLQIEEPRLRRLFGAAYEAYCRQVPRFVARLLPAPALSEGRFRWETWRQNKEWRRTVPRLGYVAVAWLRLRLFEAFLL